jgi:SAM-dependent methyltransferase
MIRAVRRQRYEDERLAGAYGPGNEMPARSLHAWVCLIGSFSPVPRPTVLDIGTGTGMFASALSDQLGSAVIGIDPSRAMLAQARRANSLARVRYVLGDALAVPVRPGGVDLVLLSRVIHHLPDRRRCATEAHRVLRPGGVAVVRTTVRDRLDAQVYEYWPRLRALDAARFPALEELVTDFTAAGFATLAVQSFAQPVWPSLHAYHAALALRPQSKFDQLSTAEFATGLRRLQRAANSRAEPHMVSERYDVLAFTAR